MEENKNKELVKDIIDHANNNEIVIMTVDGTMTTKLEDFIRQPVDAILYDLNRDFATLTSQAENSKGLRFVNDFACANIIKYLHNKVVSLEHEIKATKNAFNKNYKSTIKSVQPVGNASSIQEGFNTSLEIDI